ncbi:MAG: GNAT family N-acetyltransferase [Lachnospiraceae bacterium]|nr:GNAT family N-acetyltransferase [Lachnospiraceae bacterium]
MSVTFRMLDKKDYNKAIGFAVKGMHFGIYFNSDFLTNAYGKYFLYSEMNKATQSIAAYDGDTLIGLLISRVNDEERCFHSFRQKLYVNVIDFIQKLFFKGSAGEYDTACRQMLAEYKKSHTPDGEIIFLAADPESKIKGIGTALLNEYEKREHNKLIYLYTDDQCTYQFYEHRGFERVCEKDIVLNLKDKVNLKCMLYCKKIGSYKEELQ